jgi:hypothetical protein
VCLVEEEAGIDSWDVYACLLDCWEGGRRLCSYALACARDRLTWIGQSAPYALGCRGSHCAGGALRECRSLAGWMLFLVTAKAHQTWRAGVQLALLSRVPNADGTAFAYLVAGAISTSARDRTDACFSHRQHTYQGIMNRECCRYPEVSLCRNTALTIDLHRLRHWIRLLLLVCVGCIDDGGDQLLYRRGRRVHGVSNGTGGTVSGCVGVVVWSSVGHSAA